MTLRYCVETARRVEILSPPDRNIILFFSSLIDVMKFGRSRPYQGVRYRGS